MLTNRLSFYLPIIFFLTPISLPIVLNVRLVRHVLISHIVGRLQPFFLRNFSWTNLRNLDGLKRVICFYHGFFDKLITFSRFFRSISSKLITALYDVNFILVIFYNFIEKPEVFKHFINHHPIFWPFKVSISDLNWQNP